MSEPASVPQEDRYTASVADSRRAILHIAEALRETLVSAAGITQTRISRELQGVEEYSLANCGEIQFTLTPDLQDLCLTSRALYRFYKSEQSDCLPNEHSRRLWLQTLMQYSAGLETIMWGMVVSHIPTPHGDREFHLLRDDGRLVIVSLVPPQNPFARLMPGGSSNE